MSPLASYRRLYQLAGPLYVFVAFIGRIPLAMSQLGALLLVSTETGSYGTGGLAAGALAVANAIGSPFAGVLADRIGQRPVVLTQSLVGAAALTALVALTSADAGAPLLVAAAALAGLVMPQVGPLARVRWRPMTDATGSRQRKLIDAAFSYEGAADEASFMIGPAIVGVAAVAFSPGGAMLTAAALLAIFGCAFALHPTSRLTGGVIHTPSSGRLVTGVFVALLVSQACIGMLFGATQTGTTALADEFGQAGVAGLIHALLGVGSVIAGLATVYLPERIGHEKRILVASSALLVLSLPLLLVDSIAGLIVVVILLGFGVAPYMIGVFTLGERIVPQSRIGLAMTLLAGATGIGYALGSSTAGRLADLHGYTAAFCVTITAMAIGTLLAAFTAWRASSGGLVVQDAAQDEPAPAVPVEQDA